jgi:hypothetical protein
MGIDLIQAARHCIFMMTIDDNHFVKAGMMADDFFIVVVIAQSVLRLRTGEKLIPMHRPNRFSRLNKDRIFQKGGRYSRAFSLIEIFPTGKPVLW